MINGNILLIALIGLMLVATVNANALIVKGIYADSQGTSFAIAENGSLWVWGRFEGVDYSHPVMVPFIDDVAMVAPVGEGSAVVLKDDGTVWAWGSTFSNETAGYLGQNRTTPVQSDITDVKYISSGSGAIYAIKNDSTLWAWGRNCEFNATGALLYGCLGIPDFKDYRTLVPMRVPIDNVSTVLARDVVIVQKSDGSWWGWGDNTYYELLDGTSERRNQPEQLSIDENIAQLSSSFMGNVLALTGNGTVLTWGSNSHGQAGDPGVPSPMTHPYRVPGMSDVLSVGSGLTFSVALKEDGTVWIWGGASQSYNRAHGTLESDKPIQVPGLSGIVSITVGAEHCFAIKKDGTIWAFGRDQNGELGDGQILDPLATGNTGMPLGVRVNDVNFDTSYLSGQTTNTSKPSPSPLATPGDYIPVGSTSPAPISSSPKDTPISTQTNGFDFMTIAALLGLGLTGSIVCSTRRRRKL